MLWITDVSLLYVTVSLVLWGFLKHPFSMHCISQCKLPSLVLAPCFLLSSPLTVCRTAAGRRNGSWTNFSCWRSSRMSLQAIEMCASVGANGNCCIHSCPAQPGTAARGFCFVICLLVWDFCRRSLMHFCLWNFVYNFVYNCHWLGMDWMYRLNTCCSRWSQTATNTVGFLHISSWACEHL